MLHVILTASSDDQRVSVHCTLRQINADNSETTLKVTGGVYPLYEVGLFGNEEQAIFDAAMNALDSFKKSIVSTDG